MDDSQLRLRREPPVFDYRDYSVVVLRNVGRALRGLYQPASLARAGRRATRVPNLRFRAKSRGKCIDRVIQRKALSS